MSGSGRNTICRLLKNTILSICTNAIAEDCSHLEVDGIICLTLDKTTEYVVKIHELFSNSSNPDSVSDVDNSNSSTIQPQSTTPMPGPRTQKQIAKATKAKGGIDGPDNEVGDGSSQNRPRDNKKVTKGTNRSATSSVQRRGVEMDVINRARDSERSLFDSDTQTDSIVEGHGHLSMTSNLLYGEDTVMDDLSDHEELAQLRGTSEKVLQTQKENDSQVRQDNIQTLKRPRVYDDETQSDGEMDYQAGMNEIVPECMNDNRTHLSNQTHTPNKGANINNPLSASGRVKQSGLEKGFTPNSSMIFKDVGPFNCRFCTKSFETFYSFDNHNISSHTVYSCSYCSRSVRTKSGLKRHIDETHIQFASSSSFTIKDWIESKTA